MGAWILGIAWVGLNIGLPNWMLRLTGQQTNAPYIATWFAVSGLIYAIGGLFGGMLFDRYRRCGLTWPWYFSLDYYRTILLVGWL